MPRKTPYHKIVNDVNWKLVNEENKRLLEGYIPYLKSIDRSPLTIRSYTSDTRILFIWLLEYCDNKSFTEFNKHDMMNFQNYLLYDLESSSNRISRERANLSTLSKYIEVMLDDKYPNFKNVTKKIPAPPKELVREKTILSDEQVQWLLDKLIADKQYQKACIFALAWSSGARLSELLRFKITDFEEKNIRMDMFFKTTEKMRTKGRGRKGKMLHRYVIISRFSPYLDMWMEERKRLGIDDTLSLFVKKSKGEWGNMKETTLQTYAEQFSKLLNVDFYFHCLRHNFCTYLAKIGIPPIIIQKLVGWENINMVNIYNDAELDDELASFFNSSGIKL